MIKVASTNIKVLSLLNKIPIIRYFFILKISRKFQNIHNNSVLEKFYTDIYVANKTSKKTADHRFFDIDKLIPKYLNAHQDNYLHDIAVSNGITSDNLFEFLQKTNIQFRLDISDKYSKIYVKEGFITKVFDVNHHLNFAYWGIFFAGDKNIFFPFTVLLYKIIKKFNGRYDSDYSLYLFHPNILNKIADKTIQVIDYDIFQTKLNEQYHFVRCMNILNKGYFEDNELIKALANIKQSMKENAVLLVGRTQAKGINHASFFRKQKNKFILLEDVNEGSEIKNLVLKL